MKRITFSTEDTKKGQLLLVNARHPHALGAGAAEPLVPLGKSRGENVMLCGTAARLLETLLARVDQGGRICALSGHRTTAQQRSLFETALRQGGEQYARTYVALPGCSEHETGLAVDLAEAGAEADLITPSFPAEGVFARFRRQAAQYGFVLRYPSGKSDVTGIGYEPWHFRFVGWPHAAIMEARGLVLEEYLELLRHHTTLQTALRHVQNNRRACVFRVCPLRGEEAAAQIPEDALWQAAGDNTGGVVVTVWA